MANKLDVTSKELSSAEDQQLLFESYCIDRGISLDFKKSKEYNAYVDQKTSSAFIWFIRGLFSNIDCNPDYQLKGEVKCKN